LEPLIATFRSGDTVRSRSVSAVVLTDVIEVPVPPVPVLADWQRDIHFRLGLEAGDIDVLPLTRTRLRWPQLRDGFDATGRWMAALGLPDVLGSCDVALMASRGTPYHHDGGRYAGFAFCNLFLDADGDTDFHLPAAGRRIAIVRGTVVIFDPCQPHAIIKRDAPGFDAIDFLAADMRPQVFLTWELPIEHEAIGRAMGVTFDRAPAAWSQACEQEVWHDGAPARLCPQTGRWLGQV
jgi:hypothetical protein